MVKKKQEETIKEETKDNTLEEVKEEISKEPIEEVKEDINEEIPEEEVIPEDLPSNTKDEFNVGDTIRVYYKIIEGDKQRIQPYEGIVISKRGEFNSKSFTVRRIGADQVGIERIFPMYSPNIDSIKLIKRGKVRRSKLYYLRDKVGRAAMRIKEIKK